MAPLVFYRDYHKETKDLLSKFGLDGNKWKVESKLKAPPGKAVVNPSATNDLVAAEVEYKSATNPWSIKGLVSTKGAPRATASYQLNKATKVEVAASQGLDKPEATVELKQPQYWALSKVTDKAVDANVSLTLTPRIQLGVVGQYLLDKKNATFGGALRFADKGTVLDVATSQLDTFQIGATLPVKFDKYIKGAIGAQVDLVGQGKQFKKALCGFETICPLNCNNKAKVQVDSDKNARVTYIAGFPGWKAALSVLPVQKQYGIHFLLEDLTPPPPPPAASAPIATMANVEQASKSAWDKLVSTVSSPPPLPK